MRRPQTGELQPEASTSAPGDPHAAASHSSSQPRQQPSVGATSTAPPARTGRVNHFQKMQQFVEAATANRPTTPLDQQASQLLYKEVEDQMARMHSEARWVACMDDAKPCGCMPSAWQVLHSTMLSSMPLLACCNLAHQNIAGPLKVLLLIDSYNLCCCCIFGFHPTVPSHALLCRMLKM